MNGSHSFSFYTAAFWVSWIAGRFFLGAEQSNKIKHMALGDFLLNCVTNSLLFYFRLNRF